MCNVYSLYTPTCFCGTTVIIKYSQCEHWQLKSGALDFPGFPVKSFFFTFFPCTLFVHVFAAEEDVSLKLLVCSVVLHLMAVLNNCEFVYKISQVYNTFRLQCKLSHPEIMF